MAMGKYSRVDGRKSTNYCSPTVIVVFVGFCLVGVWMLMPSSVDPVQLTDLSSRDSKTGLSSQDSRAGFSSQDSKEDIRVEAEDKFSSQSENSSGGQEEVATKVVSKPIKSEDASNADVRDSENWSEKESDNNVVETQEEKAVGESSGGIPTGEGDSKVDDGTSDNEEANSEGKESNISTETNDNAQTEPENENSKNESNPNEGIQRSQTEESVEKPKKMADEKARVEISTGDQSEILKETTTESGAWSTQVAESESEKKLEKHKSLKDASDYRWKVCNVTAGPDYIPCLDNLRAIRKLPQRDHYQHRERHCPDEAPTCLVPLPEGYKQSIKWPKSREQVYHHLLWLIRPLLCSHY